MADRVREEASPRKLGHPRQLALQHGPSPAAVDARRRTTPAKGMDRTRAAASQPALPSAIAPPTAGESAIFVTGDSPERRRYDHTGRALFSPERLVALQPQFGAIARRLVSTLPRPQTVEIIDSFVAPFAMQAQCAFLGQPADVEAALRCWIRPCQARIYGADDERAGASSSELFEARLKAVLQARRASAAPSPGDVIDALVGEQPWGRAPSDREMLNILHDWTAGAVDEITGVLGRLVRDLAEHAERQPALRTDPARLARTVATHLRSSGYELDSPVGPHRAFGEDARVRWLSPPPTPESESGWQYRPRPAHAARLWPYVLHVQLYEALRALLTSIDRLEPALIRTSLIGRCSTSRYPTLALRVR